MTSKLPPTDLISRILQLEKRVKQLELNDPVHLTPGELARIKEEKNARGV